MRMLVLVGGLVSLLGCGASAPTEPSSATTPATTSAATTEPAPAPTTVPVAAGPTRFHYPVPVDVVNLELDEAAGTFRWGVTGCDYAHFDRGLVRREGSELVLTAAPGGTLTWFHSPGFRNEVAEVRVTPSNGGELIVTATIRGEPVTQTWAAGGTCPDCAHLGPDTTHACDAPFLGE